MKVETLTPEQEKLIEQYSAVFANLKKNIVQDLYNNHFESVLYRKFPKEKVLTMMENPQKFEKDLRDLSCFLYMVSSHYRRLIDYYSSILLYNYYIVPVNMPTKIKKTEFKKVYNFMINQCEKYNLKQEAQKLMKIVAREGVAYGIPYETTDSFYIKPFDSKYAQISSVEDGCFMFSVNLNYFTGKEYLLPMYGQQFIDAYIAYKGDPEKKTQGDKKKQWYEVPNGICIKADESDTKYSIPIFTGLLLDIYSIDDYKMLQKAKAENDNYHALALKLPTDDDGAPKMDFDVATKYYNQIAANVDDGCGVLLSPFDITDFSFKTSGTADYNAVSEAIEIFWASSGTSSLIFGSPKATSSSSLTLSVKPDEALAYNLLEQIQRYFNRDIKKMNLDYEFAIKFLQQSIFNTDEHVNRLHKAAMYGMPVKMQYCSALGMTPSDVNGMTYLEESVLGLSKTSWQNPLISSNVQSAKSDPSNTGGKPSATDNGTQVGDSGEATQNSDGNTK